MKLWKTLEEKLGKDSKKMYVARTLFQYGLRIVNEEIRLGDIKIPYTSLAKALGVDRRTVKETLKIISEDPFLRKFFEKLENAGPFLRSVSRLLGYRCLVVEVYEDKPGILARIASSLAKYNINIVQVIAEDPNLVENPKLYIIVSCNIPGETLNEILYNSNVKQVTIF